MNNLAGLMDRRVLIESETTDQTNGEPNPVWVTVVDSVPAGKKDETLMQEGPEGKTFVATGRTTWTMRWRNDIKPTSRLTDLSDGTIYNVEGIAEVGRREAIRLQTKRYNV